jgi:uncharacterized protein (TIGR00251 family)
VKIEIRVKTNARKTGIVALPNGSLVVSVKAPPIEGRANGEIVEALAQHYGKRKRDITILRGARGKNKLVEIS